MGRRPACLSSLLLSCWLAGCEQEPTCRGPTDCPGGQACAAGRCTTPDRDRDRDGIPDLLDRCPDYAPDPAFPLLDQHDSDGDGLGDVCDPCPGLADPRAPDPDGDGVGLGCDQPAEREREPYNDLPARAPELAVGRWLEGVIGPPTPEADLDWAFFRARAGDRVRLEALAWPDTSSLDPLLVVMDRATQGAAYLRLQDDSLGPRGGVRDALLELVLPATGEYLVLLTDAHNWAAPGDPRGSVSATWRLRLTRQVEPAALLALPAEPVHVRLPAGRLAGFHLDPGGPALLELHARGGGLWDPAVAVVDARGGRLVGQADNQVECPGIRDARLRLCLEGGPVEIWVESLGLPGVPPGVPAELELTASLSAPCQGGTCAESLPDAGGARLLALGLSQPAPLGVEVTAPDFSPALELLACAPGVPSPRSLASAAAGLPGSVAGEAWAEPGQHLFAGVRDRGELLAGCSPVPGAGRTFHLAAAARPPAPAPLAPGTWPLELAPGEARWFAIEGRRDERLRVSAWPAAGSAARPGLCLRSAGGWPLLARASSVAGDGPAELRWAPAEAGPVWLGLSAAEGGGGAIELSLVAEALPAAEVEEPAGPHPSPETAAPLPAGELLLRGELVPAADEIDCYSLPAPLGETLALATWAAAPGQAPDTVLRLLDGQRRALAWSDDQGGALLAALPPLPGRGADLVVCVEGRGPAAIPYRLEVRRAPLAPGVPVAPLPGELCLNEALVEPGGADLDGDGRSDGGDQYLELVNAGPYPLDLQGVYLWAQGGGAYFAAAVRLAPGEAALVLNGEQPPPGAFPAQAFGIGRHTPWLAAGPRGLELELATPARAELELGSFALPSGAAPGEAVARPADAGCARPLRPHAALPGAAGPRSPGARLDGSPFLP